MKTIKSIVQSNDGKFTEITYRENAIDINVVDKFELDEEEGVLKLKDTCIRYFKNSDGNYIFRSEIGINEILEVLKTKWNYLSDEKKDIISRLLMD